MHAKGRAAFAARVGASVFGAWLVVAAAQAPIACSRNPCCGGDPNNVVVPPPSPALRVVDSVTHAPLCTASGIVQCAGPAQTMSGTCLVACTNNLPPMCDQTSVGTYSITATVSASGHTAGQTTFSIAVGACWDWPDDGGVAATLLLAPTCASPVAHDNGDDQSWTDCVALGTYDQTEAMEACEVDPRGSAGCQVVQCASLEADAGASFAVCADVDADCYCWTFEGPGAGHVRISSCGCADDSDLPWD